MKPLRTLAGVPQRRAFLRAPAGRRRTGPHVAGRLTCDLPGSCAGRAGFTLVELIVGIAIGLVILAVTMTMLISALNLSAHSTSKAQNEQICAQALDFCEQRMRLCVLVEPLAQANDRTATGWQAGQGQTGRQLGLRDVDDLALTARLYLDANDDGLADAAGMLYYSVSGDGKPYNVFGQDFYHGNQLQLTVSQTNSLGLAPALTLTVELVSPSGRVLASQTRSLTLVNAALVVPEDTSGSVELISPQRPDILLLHPAS